MIISYAQNFEDVMLWRALKHVEAGFYIDVGANDPTIDSVTRLFYERGWRGINIEPLQSHIVDLERERPRDINIGAAAGASIGEISLWECDVRGWATADETVMAQHRANGHSGHSSRVPITTLSAICADHAPRDIHFLKIDVEGFERSVLEGMDLRRFRPWIVVVEATRPNTVEEVHDQWEELVVTADYRFIYADGVNRFYVACEHSELAAAFRHPPNIFDSFVRAPLIEAGSWAETVIARADAITAEAAVRAADADARAAITERRAADAEARTAVAELRASEAEASISIARAQAARAERSAADAQLRAGQAEIHVTALMNSTSWRVTKPIRLFVGFIRAIGVRAVNFAIRSRAATSSIALRGIVTDNAPTTIPAPTRVLDDIYAQLKGLAGAAAPDLPGKPGQALRPKLAYVSPLPPVRSGIADYSAELLPELARFYDIDVIVDQEAVTSAWVTANCPVRTVEWFRRNAGAYDRVLYHFGNSSYHGHMFQLLGDVPGVIVLHDFYLGDVQNYLETYNLSAFALTRAFYQSHGYGALAERFEAGRVADAIGKYPGNFDILKRAQGVIVHSQHSRNLSADWYGDRFADDWKVIPLLRVPDSARQRAQARYALGLSPDDFLVCSFGLVSPNKLSHRLLEAWLASELAGDPHARLIFVGERQVGDYCAQLDRMIADADLGERVQISGWADSDTFRNFLAAADIAVQLRTQSRGETSAAVLDCMNYGLPTIVNDHGAFGELPAEAVWKLPDDFENRKLTEVLETLRRNAEMRSVLGSRARDVIAGRHAPSICAEGYHRAIEEAFATARSHADLMIEQFLAQGTERNLSDAHYLALAQSIYRMPPRGKATRQLLVDVSATCRNDLKTGIQRVVRALVSELVFSPPSGFRVEPVYLSDEGGFWHYRYARAWTSGILGCPKGWMADDIIGYDAGDALLVVDFTGAYAVEAERASMFATLKAAGVGITFFIYDLLPLRMAEHFPPGQFGFSDWLAAVGRAADRAICISQAVADDLGSWLAGSTPAGARPIAIDWLHLGADIESSAPSSGLPGDHKDIIASLSAASSFLMVGTIEPRKGYLQTIEAFTRLWHDGHDVKLVIVGKEGWRGLPDDQRRTIPQIVSMLRTHPEYGRRLLWLEEASDEFLEEIYGATTCLIAASEGEGFGLPLIEAAQHRLPIIARDIPVFGEVAGANAFYFTGTEPRDLSEAVIAWIALEEAGESPTSLEMPWLTWKQSAASLLERLDLAQ